MLYCWTSATSRNVATSTLECCVALSFRSRRKLFVKPSNAYTMITSHLLTAYVLTTSIAIGSLVKRDVQALTLADQGKKGLDTNGNPWQVFQRRVDGSVNFTRGWDDYVSGFGTANGDYWLGLQMLHMITSCGDYEMRIDMTDVNGEHWFASYSTFNVGPASDYYKLTATGYSGNATDSLGNGAIPERIHNRQRFSTHDSDNDNWWNENCSAKYGGGWWYDNCYDSNLNGVYDDVTTQGIVWVNQTTRSDIHLKFVEMKFRRSRVNNDNSDMPTCSQMDIESATFQDESGVVLEFYIPPSIGWKQVSCDMETDGGNWIVFQRRMDGSVDFYRNWIDYVNGFGDITKEFWLGLEAIHQLTKFGRHELRIDMIERDGTHYYAKYHNFRIGPSSDKYRLTVDGYSGNASDSFAHSPDPWGVLDNQRFSTKDSDNDIWSDHCAVRYTGAWWYKNCLSTNLNGVYNDTADWSGVTWYDNEKRARWRLHMKFTEMKFRKKD